MTVPHTIKLFVKQEGALGLFLHYNYFLPIDKPWDTFGYPMYEDNLWGIGTGFRRSWSVCTSGYTPRAW